jgi:hypothetical protein
MPKQPPPPEPEDDEPVTEPSGKELTAKRKRQAESRTAAEKLWKTITHNMQKPHD